MKDFIFTRLPASYMFELQFIDLMDEYGLKVTKQETI